MTQPLIGVVMGSSAGWQTLQHAVHILQQFRLQPITQAVRVTALQACALQGTEGC